MLQSFLWHSCSHLESVHVFSPKYITFEGDLAVLIVDVLDKKNTMLHLESFCCCVLFHPIMSSLIATTCSVLHGLRKAVEASNE